MRDNYYVVATTPEEYESIMDFFEQNGYMWYSGRPLRQYGFRPTECYDIPLNPDRDRLGKTTMKSADLTVTEFLTRFAPEFCPVTHTFDADEYASLL